MHKSRIGVICQFIYGVGHVASVRREPEMLPDKHLTGAFVSNREVRIIADSVDEMLTFVTIRDAGVIELIGNHDLGF